MSCFEFIHVCLHLWNDFLKSLSVCCQLAFYLIPASIGLTEEQQSIQTLATDFSLNELKPHMEKWDAEVKTHVHMLKTV